jgi:DNA-binding NtrC family response regulator
MTGDGDILLVEDSQALAGVYAAYLRKAGMSVVGAENGSQALKYIGDDVGRVVLLDLQLPDMDGMEILRKLRSEADPPAVVVVTADGSLRTAVDAMREGAYDFLVKPLTEERLVVTSRNALDHVRLRRTVDSFQDGLDRKEYHGFIGSSLAMQAVYHTIDCVAASKATVFITGESGTGKEICAAAIHNQSPRRDGPFVPLNCAAIPRDIMESEIFGHVKGAFTGAIRNRSGAARDADGGTLFLDEICEMDADLQTKLLRFLQTEMVQPVGSTQQTRVDVRIICATNRDPQREIQAGRFREDLFYRLPACGAAQHSASAGSDRGCGRNRESVAAALCARGRQGFSGHLPGGRGGHSQSRLARQCPRASECFAQCRAHEPGPGLAPQYAAF